MLIELERILALLLTAGSLVGFASEIFTAIYISDHPYGRDKTTIPIWHDCIGIAVCMATVGIHFKGAMHAYTFDHELGKVVESDDPLSEKWVLRGDLLVFVLWSCSVGIVAVQDGMELRRSLNIGDMRLLPIYTIDVVLMTCIATLFCLIGTRKRLNEVIQHEPVNTSDPEEAAAGSGELRQISWGR